MATSAEHQFVTAAFIECAESLSKSELFTYAEADRSRFDFAAVLTQDHSRLVVGQTLTHHAAGIDKDLASLLLDTSGQVPVYLYPLEARNEGRFREFLHNAQPRLGDRVELLRLIRYPVFDADNASERKLVQDNIHRQVRDDLVLNVLFGRIAAVDIEILLQGTGIPGLLLAALNAIATTGFFNFPALGRSVGANPSTLRPRVQSLLAAGMLDQAVDGSYFRATQRGRVVLRIARLLLRDPVIRPELAFILDRLGLSDSTRLPALASDRQDPGDFGPAAKRARFIGEASAAHEQFGSDLGVTFLFDDPYVRDMNWVGR